MDWSDWLPIALSTLLIAGCAIGSRRYMRGVADFMAGGRTAGRYIICNAKGEAGSGVANTMARFQVIFLSGFVLAWWDAVSMPVLLFVGITGFVVYRYRQTRALTLGQFFEMRYSRRLRLFAGMLGFVAGLLNYGIFPAVGSNFFVYFLGLPVHVSLLGHPVPTYVLIMAAYLSVSLWMMTAGGQVALMVADSVSGILSHVLYVALVFVVIALVSWAQARQVLLSAPADQSMVNPFDAKDAKDFNVWYAAMTLLLNVYATMAWQAGHGFNSAARSPHELRMGNVLGYWRVYARQVTMVALTIAALTFLRHADFSAAAAPAHAAINRIADPQLRVQMTVPVALHYFLPAATRALFCVVMVLGLISGDASHLLSWGGIFIQDVVLPLRRTPLTPRQHVRLLRWSVAGVAVFAFIFSILFRQTQHIYLWWAITMGVFTSGAGAIIIGGLYWPRGTTAGAWAAVLIGSGLSLLGIAAPYVYPRFPLNGTQVSFVATIIATIAYATVSLLSRRVFDLDALLHRDPGVSAALDRPRNWFNFNADFTRLDRLVSGGILVWSGVWLVVVVVGTVWNKVCPWSPAVWADYWLATGIVIPLGVALITLVWFGTGGVLDLKYLFTKLAGTRRDAADDGTVTRPAEALESSVPSPLSPVVTGEE